MRSKNSYTSKVNAQEILYESTYELGIVTQTLSTFSSVVDSTDILLFSQDMKEVAKNRKFLFHIGDCAELFENCNTEYLDLQLKLFTDAAEVLESGLRKSVCVVGRIAGQYAKPRSERMERYGSNELLSYYGDIINSCRNTKIDRLPDPDRMMIAYSYSKKTFEYINQWEQRYQRKIYISHEALLLPYEQAFTKKYGDKWYNTSCHFPWIGMRTAFAESLHIEYIRGIQNPIAIKLGPNISVNDILEITNILNPTNIPGKLTFIYRFGVTLIEQKLAALINAIKKTNMNVILCCDPMHGNTKKNNNGIKIRKVSDIIEELKIAINLHKKLEVSLGGIHLEACGSDIYECVEDKDIKPQKYKTKVDPRLNYSQTMKVLQEVLSELNYNNK
jgi:3-deoxy-7-phosphoheptulonate synthase